MLDRTVSILCRTSEVKVNLPYIFWWQLLSQMYILRTKDFQTQKTKVQAYCKEYLIYNIRLTHTPMIPSWRAGIHNKLWVSFWRAKLHRHTQLQWPPLTALLAWKPVPFSCHHTPAFAGIAHNDALRLFQFSQSANLKLLMICAHLIASALCYYLQGCLGYQARVVGFCMCCLFSSGQVECKNSSPAGMHSHRGSNL